MASITQAITDFFNSILSLISGIFNTIFGAIQNVFSLITKLIMDLFNAAEGIVGFIIGNIFIIAVIGLAFVGYRMFTNQQSSVGKQKKTM